MAYIPIPPRTTLDPNASADINQLNDNVVFVKAIADQNTSDIADNLLLPTDGYYRNMLLNGDFRIAQERTSSSTNSQYVMDQWFQVLNATSVTWETDDTFIFSHSKYSSKVTYTAADTQVWNLNQIVPAYRSSGYFGKTAQFSCKVKQTAISAGACNLRVGVYCPSVVDNHTLNEVLIDVTVNSLVLDGTDQDVNFELDLSGSTSSGYTVKTGMRLLVQLIQSGATGTSTVYIGDVQINEGDVVLPFQPRDDKAELDIFFHEVAMFGIAESTSLLPVSGNFKTEMFRTPSVASFDDTPGAGSTIGDILRVATGGVTVTITATPGDKNGFDWLTFSGTPLIVGEAYVLRMRLDARIA